MPRTALTVQTVLDKYPDSTANAADITFTAGDAANDNSYVSTGREILLVNNTGAGARTVTIHSSPDDLGREQDVTAYSLAAGEYAAFGPLPIEGWRQSDGLIHVDPEHAEVEFAVLRLPD